MGRAARGLIVLLLAAPFALAPYSGDDAIANLRARLRYRGYGPEVTAGPMVALWSDEAPRARNPAMRYADAGAYLVMTDGGAWWVWPSGLDAGPLADVPPALVD